MNVTVEIKAPELVEAINNLALALAGGMHTDVAKIVATEAKPKKEKPVAQEEVQTAPVDEPHQPEEPNYVSPLEEPTFSQEELRAVATILHQGGHASALRKLFASIGVNKLTEIPVEQSGLLMTRMKEIIKAEGLE